MSLSIVLEVELIALRKLCQQLFSKSNLFFQAVHTITRQLLYKSSVKHVLFDTLPRLIVEGSDPEQVLLELIRVFSDASETSEAQSRQDLIHSRI